MLTLIARTKLLGISSVVALLLSTASFAAININVDYLRKSVVFLYGSDAAGNIDSTKPLGTGFIVQIPMMSNPVKAWKIVVTARHIADPEWAHCGMVATKLFMRVNKKNFDPSRDEVGTVDIPLAGPNVGGNTWLFSDDPEVDAAVIPIDGDLLERYDVEGIHVSEFPTPEEQKALDAGDTVISAGLLPGLSGKKRNYPFFKFGNISSITDEPVEANCGTGQQSRPMKVWFVAANLAPGNSGSPICYVPLGWGSMIQLGANLRPLFVGIQSVSFISVDIAGMTPAKYVYDLIVKMKAPDADLSRNAQPKKP